jgi:DNA-binding IclR family transcriptional regulator
MNDNPREEAGTQRRVGSVKAAIAILRYLERLQTGAGVNAIARALEISPSSCFNLLKTLADERFLDFEPTTKLYTLGPGAIALGRSALDAGGAFALAKRRMEQVADAHHVTVALWRLHRGEQLLLVGLAESEATTRIHMTVGHRVPVAAGAAGRCLLAWSDEKPDAVARRLKVVKWAVAPDPDTYLRELAETRSRGWALDEGGFLAGVTSLAAPVLNAAGLAQYCVATTMFSAQHGPQDYPQIADDLRSVADWLAERLFLTDPKA